MGATWCHLVYVQGATVELGTLVAEVERLRTRRVVHERPETTATVASQDGFTYIGAFLEGLPALLRHASERGALHRGTSSTVTQRRVRFSNFGSTHVTYSGVSSTHKPASTIPSTQAFNVGA